MNKELESEFFLSIKNHPVKSMLIEGVEGVKKLEKPKFECPSNTEIISMCELSEKDKNPKLSFAFGGCTFVIAEYNDGDTMATHESNITSPNFIENIATLKASGQIKLLHLYSPDEETINMFKEIFQEVKNFKTKTYGFESKNAMFKDGQFYEGLTEIPRNNFDRIKPETEKEILIKRNEAIHKKYFQDFINYEDSYSEEKISELIYVLEESFIKDVNNLIILNKNNKKAIEILALKFSFLFDKKLLNKIIKSITEDIQNNINKEEKIAVLTTFLNFMKYELHSDRLDNTMDSKNGIKQIETILTKHIEYQKINNILSERDISRLKNTIRIRLTEAYMHQEDMKNGTFQKSRTLDLKEPFHQQINKKYNKKGFNKR